MLDSLYNNFKLPIQYLEGSKQIIENLDPDLELTKPNVGSEVSVYQSILQPKTIFGKQHSVAGVSSWHYAIEHINTQGNVF